VPTAHVLSSPGGRLFQLRPWTLHDPTIFAGSKFNELATGQQRVPTRRSGTFAVRR
jgi:hypothetical protein